MPKRHSGLVSVAGGSGLTPTWQRGFVSANPITIADLPGRIEDSIRLQGWVYNKRSSKKLQFLQLRDGTGVVQGVVFKPEADEALWELADSLTPETAVEVEGTVSG